LKNEESTEKPIKPTNYNVLAQIRNEAKRQFKVHHSHVEDLCATKTFCDQICLASVLLPGYLREISVEPLGALLLCNLQVRFVVFPFRETIFNK
jgi:hypothetical protein